jgi:hypothetical protein
MNLVNYHLITDKYGALRNDNGHWETEVLGEQTFP